MFIKEGGSLTAHLQCVRRATNAIAIASSEQKNTLLHTIANKLLEHKAAILAANKQDKESAQQLGFSAALIDRLSLENRLHAFVEDIYTVADLPDPIGHRYREKILANGLRLYKQRVPLGILAVIYESRPNVTIDVACLALKSGNAVVLRGGKEVLRTNRALIEAIHEALQICQLPCDLITFIDTEDRALLQELLRKYELIDLVIPRGSGQLHQFCRENSSIPVITGGIGICHLFVDETVQLDKAIAVIHNAKTQRPTVCNALDTLLIHRLIAKDLIPPLVETLAQAGVTFCAEEAAFALMPEALRQRGEGIVRLAQLRDWDTEWLNLTLGIKVVDDLQSAIEHIHAHSSGHSDGILTENKEHAALFCQKIDSAVVYVNASTRFTDGGQLGLGSEVAVSTQKIQARGPMGLEELTSYKWIVEGDYHVRS